jgi:hypothetical protein
MRVAGGSFPTADPASWESTSSDPGPEMTSAEERSYAMLVDRPTAVSIEPR